MKPSDFVCYAVVFDDCKEEPLYCVGTSEKDIVNSVCEWSERILSIKYIGPAYVASQAAKEANE